MRIGVLYGSIAALHVLAWGAYLHYAGRFPSLVGLGLTAYLFGLRHAFDADHIAAVDDTIRFMLQKGRRSVDVGFFFSLGHSSIVLLLSIAIVLSASFVKQELPALQAVGQLIGSAVSASRASLNN